MHVQNATLAGGVAIGTTASILAEPHSAIIVGAVAGTISVLGYKYLTPFLARRWNIHDTCGVNNLHGLPGLLAGLTSIIVAAVVSTDSHSESMYSIYHARVPRANTTEFLGLNASVTFKPGSGRSAGEQAMFQLWALLATVSIAITGGVITGFLLRLKCFDPVEVHGLFDDVTSWEVAEPDTVNFIQVKPITVAPIKRPLRFKTKVKTLMATRATH